MSDDEQHPDRAAPSRKRVYLKEQSDPPAEQCPDDEGAEDMLQNVTGKRFSITKLFSRKNKKDANAKEEDSEKEQDVETTENGVEKSESEKT